MNERLAEKFDSLSSLPDNSVYFVYSSDSHTLFQIFRDKTSNEGKVYENWLEIQLSALPKEFENRKILAQYYKTVYKPKAKKPILET